MGRRHSDYEDFVEAMYDERSAYRYDYDSRYDYYLYDDDDEEEGVLNLLVNKFYWIKLLQRHWKKTFNTNKKYKGMLSIYKL